MSREYAGGDPNWLGSPEHLSVLRDALPTAFALPNASLKWGPPGAPGSVMGSTQAIVLERPVPIPNVTAEDVAEYTILSLLHEALHIEFSTPFGAYAARKRALSPTVQRPVERLFQLLEDGRITARGGELHPELGPALDKFLDEAGRQIAVTGPATEGPDPRSMREQLFFALQHHALRPDKVLTLHPRVQRRLGTLDPTIERAHSGDTERCGLAAIELVDAVMKTAFPN